MDIKSSKISLNSSRNPSEALKKLVQGQGLGFEEMADFVEGMILGRVDEAKMAAFLAAMSLKGPSKEEILGAVQVFQTYALKVETPPYPLMDTCGTGGKAYTTLNISTLSAFVAASFGLRVAKHGNRSFRGLLGSAQILEHFGVNVDLKPKKALKVLSEVGITFFLASSYHPAMQAIKDLRAKLPFRTLFNLLGPLTNPLPLAYQVVGVYDSSYLDLFVECLRALGRQSAAVVFGEDGQDELSLSAASDLCVLDRDGRVEKFRVYPEDFGLQRAPKGSLLMKTQAEQLHAFREVLEGRPSPWLDAVALNAGLALFIGGVAHSVKEGVQMAKEALISKSPLRVFERFQEASKSHGTLSS